MTPTLWGRASSVNVQKVMWALAESKVEYVRKDAGGRYGITDTAAFGDMAPLRRVPVWQESNLIVWESHAILRHLGRGPASRLWPKDAAARACADQWMDFTNTTLMPPFIGAFYQLVRYAPHERSRVTMKAHLVALDAALDVINAQLEKSEWIAGDRMTLADVAAGTPMFRYYDLDIERSDRPALAAWYRRLTERLAYRAHVMTSYDELRSA